MHDALERTGSRDDTLVVFTSDNGGERFSDNWPLVGGKMDLTEGGIRVPWIAHWPRGDRGRRRQRAALHDDGLVGDDARRRRRDARDPAIRSTASRCCRCCATRRAPFDRPLYWRMNHRGQRALRDGRWKYLRVDGHDYLFDIPADERERANRAPREPARLDAMRDDWEAWNATMPPIPDRRDREPRLRREDMPQR